MSNFTPRDAISRAEFFLDLAKDCPGDKKNDFEAFMEASIIFARSALLRTKTKYKGHPQWKPWWKGLLKNPAVDFIRKERNWILHEAPPQVGQTVRLGAPPAQKASELYYYEDPEIPATETIEKHLEEMKKLIQYAENTFSKIGS